MPSSAAVVGLRYDSVDLQTDDLQIFLEIHTGLNEPPSVRGGDYVVPARAGRVEANRINDVLPIELVGMVNADPAITDLGDARSSYRANATALRALFHPNRSRATLEADLEDGSTITIEARPLPTHIWNEGAVSAKVNIELEGYDDWAVAGS
jgi:hypothetical protein